MAAALDTPPQMLYNGIGTEVLPLKGVFSKNAPDSCSYREHFLSTHSEVDRQRETCNRNKNTKQLYIRHSYHLPP